MNQQELAAELTKVGMEHLRPNDFKDTAEKPAGRGYESKPTITVEEWALKVAGAALAAAKLVGGQP